MATSKASAAHLGSVVVELAPLEGIAQELAEHVGARLPDSASFVAECEALIKAGELRKLVETFVKSIADAAPRSDADEQTARLKTLLSLLRHLPPDAMQEVIPNAASTILKMPAGTGAADADARMRLDALSDLYAVVDARSPTRYGTLLSMLQFATSHKIFNLFDASSSADAGDLCARINADMNPAPVSPAMHRSLLRAFCDAAAAKRESIAGSEPADAQRAADLKEQRMLFRLLEALDGKDATDKERADAEEYAARAAVLSIAYPLPGDAAHASSLEGQALEGMSRAATALLAAEKAHKADSSVLTATPATCALFSAVQALAASAKWAQLHKLLLVFASGGLDTFEAFEKSDGAVFDSVAALDRERCRRSMRLLTLATLASRSETVTYAAIAEALRVDRGDVERWVMDGVTSKVVDAKLDQLEQTIVMSRGSQRLLAPEQWLQVQGKLQRWTSNVRELLSTVRAAQEQLPGRQQEAC